MKNSGSKNSGKKGKAKIVVEEVAAVEVAEVAEVAAEVAEVAAEVVGVSYESEFTDLIKMADEFLQMARSFKARVTKLEKTVIREHKVLDKKSRGKKRRIANPDAPPSGFAKPGQVSDELRKFLELGSDELIARTEVTKAINCYCKKHSLQDEADKRRIMPDSSLRKLLKLKKGQELTFFNLQTFLKVHFPNKEGVYPTA